MAPQAIENARNGLGDGYTPACCRSEGEWVNRTPHHFPRLFESAPLTAFPKWSWTGKMLGSSAPVCGEDAGSESPCFLASISSAMAKPNGAQAASILAAPTFR